MIEQKKLLKVLSYWNLNFFKESKKSTYFSLKVLSYWNLNKKYYRKESMNMLNLKYYHIGI